MLCKMTNEALIKIRVDMVSDRPEAATNYQLQGTDGVYESSRGGPGDCDKIWLRALDPKATWYSVSDLLERGELLDYLPEVWRSPSRQTREAGHGGGDYFVIADFMRAVKGESETSLGIHEAMDMTLPGLISQQSIAQGGAWLPVPDSRSWLCDAPQGQLQMVWPEHRLSSPPTPAVGDEYELRQYRSSDRDAYLHLMQRAGFRNWDETMLRSMLPTVLPGGFLVVEHTPTGRVVATAMATHNRSGDYPARGAVDWVAADPEHSGRGLGLAVTAACVKRLVHAGYTSIFLETDDDRLPALKIYLKLGFEPRLISAQHKERWEKVFAALCCRSLWE